MWNGFLIKIKLYEVQRCEEPNSKLYIKLHFQFPFLNGINIPVWTDLLPSEYLEAINKTNIK